MRLCRNPHCYDFANLGTLRLCPSCRYMARWAFASGAFLAGVVYALLTRI